MSVYITTLILASMLSVSFGQFRVPTDAAGFIANAKPVKTGEATVPCASITRTCQIRCKQREREGKTTIEFVRWTIDVLRTLVSCETYEANIVPLLPCKYDVIVYTTHPF